MGDGNRLEAGRVRECLAGSTPAPSAENIANLDSPGPVSVRNPNS